MIFWSFPYQLPPPNLIVLSTLATAESIPCFRGLTQWIEILIEVVFKWLIIHTIAATNLKNSEDFCANFLPNKLGFKVIKKPSLKTKVHARCKESKLRGFTWMDWIKTVCSVILIQEKHCQNNLWKPCNSLKCFACIYYHWTNSFGSIQYDK